MSKSVLVTGATGTIGRDVAKRLSQRGVSVRAGVRDRAKARKQFGSDIALAPFDFENEKTFSEALEGMEKIFLLPPLLPNQLELMNAFVDAAKRAGVRHIVKLSAIGVDDDTRPTAVKWHAVMNNTFMNRASPLRFCGRIRSCKISSPTFLHAMARFICHGEMGRPALSTRAISRVLPRMR